MKWNKINTVRQISEDGKWMLYKMYDRCWNLSKINEDGKCDKHYYRIFETLKEAKVYVEGLN